MPRPVDAFGPVEPYLRPAGIEKNGALVYFMLALDFETDASIELGSSVQILDDKKNGLQFHGRSPVNGGFALGNSTEKASGWSDRLTTLSVFIGIMPVMG